MQWNPLPIMQGRPRKIAKLQSLRARLPYISASALSALLRAVAEDLDALPPATSRADIRSARDTSVAEVTLYGPIHQHSELATNAGGVLSVEVQHPLAMLCKMCAASTCFSELIMRCSDSTPAEPLEIILYMDEILPGNQLAYKSARKFWACYWSLLNFGSAALADEEISSASCIPICSYAHSWYPQ